MGEPLIRVEGLRKHFPVSGGVLGTQTVGHVRAVDGVSFDIEPGETLALVGESGCGKTTVARVILRLQRCTEGRVLLEGKDVHQLTGDDLRWFRTSVQAVFQDPWASLNPRMRVGTTVAEPLVVNRDVSKDEEEERVAAILERVGLSPGAAGLFPHEFSGGQRQRIALASALITDPRLVVLDEPVSALDVAVQARILNLLKELQDERGMSFLMISHDLETVRYIADRVAVMYMGQIAEHAGADELFDNPQHPYTNALFDSSLPLHPDDPHVEAAVTGEMPSPIDPPSGCRFRTRCPHAMDVCRQTPADHEVGPGHLSACHLHAEDVAVPAGRDAGGAA